MKPEILTDMETYQYLELYNKMVAQDREYVQSGEAGSAALTMMRLDFRLTLNHNLNRKLFKRPRQCLGVVWKVQNRGPRADYGYGLYWEQQLVYVGVTSVPEARFKAHRGEKNFDKMVVCAVKNTRDEILVWERESIAALQPVLNKDMYDEAYDGAVFNSTGYTEQLLHLMMQDYDLPTQMDLGVTAQGLPAGVMLKQTAEQAREYCAYFNMEIPSWALTLRERMDKVPSAEVPIGDWL